MLDWIDVFTTIALGLTLRFGIPVGLTGLILWVLKRLDESWQVEAKEAQRAAFSLAAAERPACWEVRQCSPALRAQCPAYLNHVEPCWQVMRAQSGRLPERCLTCQFFRSAPILHPQVSHS